jgi:hypothetical protein
LCWQEEHEDEEERTKTPRAASLESVGDDALLQEMVRRGLIQGGEFLSKRSPAATAPPTQSGGAGRVPMDIGEADHEATCGDDAELDRDMDGDYVELAAAASTSPAPQRKSSRFRGVGWHEESRKWRVNLKVHGVRKYRGHFDDEEAAARAYDKAAIDRGRLDGLNFDDYDLPETAPASPAPQQKIRRFQGVSLHKTSSKCIELE